MTAPDGLGKVPAMLAEERRALILDILAQRGSASVRDLHRRLKVSAETVRRDITRLAGEGRLRKTHGGALAMDAVEPVFDERLAVNAEGKERIGRAAAALVPDGASLLIDSGTTTLALAEALAQGGARNLTVITNDIHVAGRLAGRNGNRVLLAGGEFLGSEGATMGRDATEMLAHYHTDFAFIGASALSSHPRLLDFSREAAALRGLMIEQARTPVLLADHTKFNRVAPVRVEHLERVRIIIVDQRPKGALARALARLDAKLAVAARSPATANGPGRRGRG